MELTRRHRGVSRLLSLGVLVVLLAIQPAALLARAQEPAPLPQVVTVVGVVGATLRTGPDGSTAAVAIVPRGDLLTVVGPARVTGGVTWWQVRTADGKVGFLPAGLLAPAPGTAGTFQPPAVAQGVTGASSEADTAQSPIAPPLASGSVARDAGTPGAPPIAEQGVADTNTPGAGSLPSGVSPAQTATPVATRVPASTLKPPRTVVERRRGRDIQVALVDEERAPNGRRMAAGRIVVGFKPGANQTARVQAHQAAGAQAAVRAGLPEVSAVEVPAGTVNQALAAYRARPDVAWAEPDYLHRATLQPNDPLLPSQNGVNKIGSQIAWDVTTGKSDVTIAVLDCGIYSESSPYPSPDGKPGHEDLRGKIAPILVPVAGTSGEVKEVAGEKNFSNATTGADDWCNHGTYMAGIAGAHTNADTATGVASISYSSRLLNGKVLNDQGVGQDSWVAEGIVWAADNGASVISMSLGSSGPCSQTMQTAVNYAWERGVVLVAAAGNGGDDRIGDPSADSPSSCDHVISVGAINQDDSRATFSNFGPTSSPRVQVAAPGVNVLSTNNVGTYGNVTGTSPATPHVAAVAALVKARYGGAGQSIVDRLLSTADPIVGTGTLWANGRINAAAAVGPESCSPRPPVMVTATPNGATLDVTVAASGVGNAIRYVRVGGESGAAVNAALTFPGTSSEAQGAKFYVPTSVGTTFTFQVARTAPGASTTVPFTVVDGCGIWNSLVGGGTAAGF